MITITVEPTTQNVEIEKVLPMMPVTTSVLIRQNGVSEHWIQRSGRWLMDDECVLFRHLLHESVTFSPYSSESFLYGSKCDPLTIESEDAAEWFEMVKFNQFIIEDGIRHAEQIGLMALNGGQAVALIPTAQFKSLHNVISETNDEIMIWAEGALDLQIDFVAIEFRVSNKVKQ